jgi:hypothetical protein
VKDLAPDIVRQRLLIEGLYTADIDEAPVKRYLSDVAGHLNLRTYGTPIVHAPGGAGKMTTKVRCVRPAHRLRHLAARVERERFFAVAAHVQGNAGEAVRFTQEFFAASAVEQRGFRNWLQATLEVRSKVASTTEYG